jgi:hypothetical protein
MSFQHHKKCAGAAADVENSLARHDVGLIDEIAPRTIAAYQSNERIVEWQKQVVSRCGKKSSFRKVCNFLFPLLNASNKCAELSSQTISLGGRFEST